MGYYFIISIFDNICGGGGDNYINSNLDLHKIITKSDDNDDNFNGEVFRGVLSDSLVQFKYQQSQNRYSSDINVEEKHKTFFKSFGEQSYQGVIETEKDGKYYYQTKNDEIFWEAFSNNSTYVTGNLNMNQFLKENHPNLYNSNSKCPICWVIGAIGVGIGVTCAYLTSDCTSRCDSLVCPSGSTKVCESSCLTMACGVACQHMEDQDDLLNPPWANGDWSSPFWQWTPYNHILDDKPGDDNYSVIGH